MRELKCGYGFDWRFWTLVLGCWALGNGVVVAQSMGELIGKGDEWLGKGQPDSALPYFERAATNARDAGDAPVMVEAYLGAGYAQYFAGRYASAQATLEQGYGDLMAFPEPPDSLRRQMLRLLAPVCEASGDVEAALRWALDALAIHPDTLRNRSYALLLGNVGSIYESKNDFINAVAYYEAANQVITDLPTDPESEEFLAVNRNNLGLTQLRLNRYPAAVYNLELARAYVRANFKAPYPSIYYSITNNLGLALVEQGLPEGLNLLQELARETPPDQAEHPKILGNLGYALMAVQSEASDTDRAGEALAHLLQALDLGQTKLKARELGQLYFFAAQARSSLPEPAPDQVPSRLSLTEKGIEALLKSGGLTPDSLGTDALVAVPDKRTLVRLLALRAQDSDRPIEDWREAFHALDLLRTGMVSEDAKGFFSGYFSRIGREAIGTFWALRQGENGRYSPREVAAFGVEVMERNKAMILWEAVQKNEIGADPEWKRLVAEERELRQSRDFLRQQLNLAQQAGDTVAIDRTESYLLQRQQELDRLAYQLEQLRPSWTRSRPEAMQRRLDDLQRWARENETTIVEFMVPDGLDSESQYAGAIVRIDADRVEFAPLTFAIDSLGRPDAVVQLINLYSDWQGVLSGNDDFARFSQYAPALFASTLGQLFPHSLPDRLLIVPDGSFSYFPFETLVTNPSAESRIGFRQAPYLLRSCEISYALSGAFLLDNSPVSPTPLLPCLAFAPSYADAPGEYRGLVALRDADQELPGALAEVQALSRSIAGDFRYGAEALKSDFVALASQYRVLHLAMHGVLNPRESDFSYLRFAPTDSGPDTDRLYQYEIARMQLAAELVVLSACETGLGRYVRGEGVQSLARAFFQAGANSVVMSLWKLEDGASAALMADYYAELAEGQRKSAALRTAKLKYLDGADDLTAHPAFWAGMVQIGSTAPLEQEDGSGWGLWIVGLIGAWLVVLAWKMVGKKGNY